MEKIRPVFMVSEKMPYYEVFDVHTEWTEGDEAEELRQNIASMHSMFTTHYPDKRILEVSSKSTIECGVGGSAFNLHIFVPSAGRKVPVENLYQCSKVFSDGGPYTDLLLVTPKEAKRDTRLTESGSLTGFEFDGVKYPVFGYYDYIYIKALLENPDTANGILTYDAFTDIYFDPVTGLNCQARTCAIFVSLSRQGLIDKVTDYESYVRIVRS